MKNLYGLSLMLLAGFMFDQRGNYEIAIWSNIALLAISAALVWSIGDNRPGARVGELAEQGSPA